ncbi:MULTISPECIES: aspartate/glutamate racemase family protein [unclassified Variovorax]|jgi:Asp/Glu/hydantoin racemase|uniref:aspartate/glutamate racemase family protein n=1 Tax=unclassified Variovorax TaxID=663243 RepID=UPI002B22A798|nr:aspartate/glutamate racemase family protein [Variovorax sp. LG9.2]MEB0056747.1 aspartate/glutamate racemase family protein [Variovorax sp. LG9.2]
MKTVAVVHTGPATVQPIKQQFQELLPDVRVINIVDDSLLNDVIAAGHLTEAVAGRILTYMQEGQKMGAVAILNACSSVGEAATAARAGLSIPVVKIDERMAERAVALGPRIGVVATVRTTLEPTIRLIRAKAEETGQQIEISEGLAEGAFQALLEGKTEAHDEVVRRTILSLVDKVDVIVLAQASMARLTSSLGDLKVPVLSSPRSGVEAVRALLETLV